MRRIVTPRRHLLFVVPLILLLIGCAGAGNDATQAPPVATLVSPATTAPTATVPPTAQPTASPTATAYPTAVPSPTSPPEANDLSLTADHVFVHPVPQIYSGDNVSFQIMAVVPDIVSPNDVEVSVSVPGLLEFEGTLNDTSLAGKPMGIYPWVWDTTGAIGDYEVIITLDPGDRIAIGDENPDNNQVVIPLTVYSDRLRPLVERRASWVDEATDCCVLHVVTGTAAHRDLPELKAMTADAVRYASEVLGETPNEKLHIYLIDRIIGQGGYAGSTIAVSYVDRNYSGGGMREVLVHEAVHLLDRQFAPNRIPFLAEGLAVWVTGGHYKPEDLDVRAKALRTTNLYVPLGALIDDFYPHQHEIGYLEAGALMEYLVNTYGWEPVRAFYAAVSPTPGLPHSVTVDETLRDHFGKSLAEVEAEWLSYLDTLPSDEATVNDLLATVRFYNVMRRYQLHFDPTAHYLQAWLPFPQELEQRGETANLMRHPTSELNVTLEVMLGAVDRAINNGNYSRANVIMDSIDRVLTNNGLFGDPLGMSYRDIVHKLTGLGYEVHQLDLEGTQAIAQVSEGLRPKLKAVTLTLRNSAWVLLG